MTLSIDYIMPTAYTELVANNDDCTFSQFAMRCAREFGALAAMRDDPLDTPIPEQFEPDDFYRKQYESSKAAYDAFIANSPTEEELSKEYDEYVATQKEQYAKVIAEKQEKRGRYDRMLTKVLKWEPPTPDHEGLRRFMIQQLQDSIEFDCTEYDLALPEREQYITYGMDPEVPRGIRDRNHARWKSEVERVSKTNRWLKDLRDSLEDK